MPNVSLAEFEHITEKDIQRVAKYMAFYAKIDKELEKDE